MIFYFTGTGNSLYVAKKIQEIDGDEIVDMGKALNEKKFNYKIKKGEKIGIVAPVYFFGLPNIVSEFINQIMLEIDENPFVYTVITCGGNIGNADKDVSNLLKLKNLQLDASYSINMPGNYVMMYDVPNKEDMDSALLLAEKDIAKLVENIKINKKGDFAKHGPIAAFSFIAKKAYGIFRKTKKFYVTDDCTNCGLCEESCPSKVIHINHEKPEWIGKKCSHCTACINRCPSKAIEYGNSTKKRNRYVNPNVEFN
ncbi:MAG: EFR1 family ferrodoxin [Methanobacteriaceae archaeon]